LEHKISLLELETQKQSDKSPELSPEQIDQRITEYRNQMIDIDQELREIAFQERHSTN
jgi:hypothetical protein